jgi:hypothetical protein
MGEIADFLKAQEAARNTKTPLERPEIIDDLKADPAKRSAAAQEYAAKLLQRRTLTTQEALFLQSEIARHLRGE